VQRDDFFLFLQTFRFSLISFILLRWRIHRRETLLANSEQRNFMHRWETGRRYNRRPRRRMSPADLQVLLMETK